MVRNLRIESGGQDQIDSKSPRAYSPPSIFGGVVVVDADLPRAGQHSSPEGVPHSNGDDSLAGASVPRRRSNWAAFEAALADNSLKQADATDILANCLLRALSLTAKYPERNLPFARRVLSVIENNRAYLNPTSISIIASSTDAEGLTPLHKAASIKEAKDIVFRLIKLGADPFVRAEFESTELGALGVKVYNTPFIFALYRGEFDNALAISSLVDRPFLKISEQARLAITVGMGEHLITIAESSNWDRLSKDLNCLYSLKSVIGEQIVREATNWVSKKGRVNALHCALIEGAPTGLVLDLYDLGARVSVRENRPSSKQYEIYDRNRRIQRVEERDLVEEISHITSSPFFLQSGRSNIRIEARSLFCEHQNPQHLYYYLDLYADACLSVPPGLCESGAKLAGHLQFAYRPLHYQALIEAVEEYLDQHHADAGIEGAHPFFREMALLLWHPDFALDSESPGAEQIGHITRAITAQKQWISHSLPLKWSTVFNWMRLGKLTQDFIGQKWDTLRTKVWHGDRVIREEKSLIEEFGAERIKPRLNDYHLAEEGTRSKPHLGTGYLIKGAGCHHSCELQNVRGGHSTFTMAPETIIEERQSYYRIYHPRNGVLFISNSSPDFGRDIFREPFYFGPAEDLSDWGPEQQLDLSPDDLEIYCYPIDGLEINEPRNRTDIRVDFLINQYLVFRDAYRHWKFNNDPIRAWDLKKETDEEKLIGGHRTFGFKRVVNFLDRVSRGSAPFTRGEALLDLAFCDPNLPPRYPHTFVDHRDTRVSKLPVTPKVLTALKNIVAAKSPVEEYEEDFAVGGIRNFIQLGLTLGSKGELIILDHAKAKAYYREESRD